jgi:hypothetical protein
VPTYNCFHNKGGKRKVKVGLVTYKPELVEGFEIPVYYSKWADGQSYPAAKKMQNDVTCFCDAKAIRDDPSMVALSKNGPALRKTAKQTLPLTLSAQHTLSTKQKF